MDGMKGTPMALAALVLVTGFARCAPPARTGDFDSPDPASRLYAINRAGESKDVTKIPQLVDQLDCDDPAVRLFAIDALERITGERLGYNPYADDIERRDAVDRWTDAVKNKRFAVGKENKP